MSTTETETRDKVLQKADRILARPETRDEKLEKICRMLAGEFEIFDWVGFYLVDPEADRELVLGPYVGEDTEHTRIPFGEGICGQAAESLETFVVQDVSEEDNYLACSVHVKAEIVVPVMKGDTFVGELDIDSHTRDSIREEHRELLEGLCDRVAEEF